MIYCGSKYHETYFLPYQMFSTVKRCIHTKFGWIWSSELSPSNKFSFKSVENWYFAGLQKASKQAQTEDVLNRSESLTSWEFNIFWISKIGQFLLLKQLTSNLCNSDITLARLNCASCFVFLVFLSGMKNYQSCYNIYLSRVAPSDYFHYISRWGMIVGIQGKEHWPSYRRVMWKPQLQSVWGQPLLIINEGAFSMLHFLMCSYILRINKISFLCQKFSEVAKKSWWYAWKWSLTK